MKRSINIRFAMVIASVAAVAALYLPQAAADANEEGQVALVCYKWSGTGGFDNERLRLSVRKPAPITEIVPAQQTWGMTGRHVNVCGEGTASVVRGVIVADETEGTSHMGIMSIVARGDGVDDACRSVSWNCTADAPVRTPDAWQCEGHNEYDEYLGSATLEKMSSAEIEQDAACQFFEAGMSVTDGAIASGTYGN